MDKNVDIPIMLIGGGGHASVIVDIVDELNRRTSDSSRFELKGYYDNNECSSKITPPYLGSIEQCRLDSQSAKEKNIHFVCCIGDNATRKRVVESMSNDALWCTLIHPSAIVSHTSFICSGTVVCAGAFIGPQSKIGHHSIINTHASIDHECCIGNYTHIAPGANLCGNVIVGDLSLIGVGTNIVPKVHIAERVTIGAGSTVIGSVADGLTKMGLVKEEENQSAATNAPKRLCWVAKKPLAWSRIRTLLTTSINTNHFANFGPCVTALEIALRRILLIDESKAIIAIDNGTSALHAAASALRIISNKQEMRFATQAYTFPSSAQGSLEGSVIVDIDHDGGIALEKLPDHISGIIVTNAFGHVVDIEKYTAWAAKLGKYLIFDNAATSFTLYQGRNSLNFGTAATISFHHTKPIGFGEGGALVIDRQFEQAVRLCINFGYDVPRGNVEWHSAGSNFKMSDVQAAFILSYLDRFDEIRIIHQRLYRKVEEYIRDLNPPVKMTPNFSSNTPFNSCLPLLFNFAISEDLIKYINKTESIDVRKYYKPLTASKTVSPNAHTLYDRIVCFPCQSDMTDASLSTIAKIVIKLNTGGYTLPLS